MRNQLIIFEQVSPEPNNSNLFRIAEVFMTVDGPRTRLTHASYKTFEAAKTYVDSFPKPA